VCHQVGSYGADVISKKQLSGYRLGDKLNFIMSLITCRLITVTYNTKRIVALRSLFVKKVMLIYLSVFYIVFSAMACES
jgi:hypothetical protein